MDLANDIAGSARRSPERLEHDRRWCTERRVAERRLRDLRVANDRRRFTDRRTASNRRSGLDRRGNAIIKTLWFHRCSKAVGEQRQCGQPAILRSSFGWRCFWHLDRRFNRRGA